MQATAHAATLIGLEAHHVRVEVDIARGTPAFDLVGLPEASVRESRVRVRSALDQTGYPFPMRRVTVNLAPADLRKHGAGFDLAIAVCTLVANRECPDELLAHWMLIGELSLTGALRPVRGALAQVLCARKLGFRGAIVPNDNAAEVARVEGIEVRRADSLRSVVDFLANKGPLEPANSESPADGAAGAETKVIETQPAPAEIQSDLSDVRGQGAAKRALEIAAAGAHNVLFVGPPGAGKTMLARTLPGILPPLSFDEALEVTSVYSVAGMLRAGQPMLERRPFRAPHHTASTVGLVGGGDPPRPGEIALAHHGVLFLDELPEYPREALEALREPLEEGSVTVVRARSRSTFPARFTLVAAMNPCPCGYHGDPSDRCSCTDERVRKYRGRVSGPLLDRIDLLVPLPPVRVSELNGATDGPRSAEVRERVVAAREAQYARAHGRGERDARESLNAYLSPRALRDAAVLDDDARALLSSASERMGLSARAATRAMRVARTIADLEGERRVAAIHVAEAVGYRAKGLG